MMGDYWKDNGIEKPQQVVVCAAIKVGEIVFCGARHCDRVMREQAHAAGTTLKSPHQGFIDQFGDFLTRERALEIAKANGQVDKTYSARELFSEDLY